MAHTYTNLLTHALFSTKDRQPLIRTDLTGLRNQAGPLLFPTAIEGVKKSSEGEKHFTQRRKGLEGAKKTRQFFLACLCVLAPWRELFDFFTPSVAVGHNPSA